MNSAVLVIDVQQGLCEGESAAYDTFTLIRRINTITAAARAAGVPLWWIQHESAAGYLEFNSLAWQLARGLQVNALDRRVRKTTPDAFNKTDLFQQLQAAAVSNLIICGMHSEFCIDTTVRRALALGFEVVLVSDGHTSAGNAVLCAAQVIAHHNTTLSNIQSFGPRVRLQRADELRFPSARQP
jgi:nicotinamidase-related amidase